VLCDVIQSVHSLKVLSLVAAEAARLGKRQRIFLQVNVSRDPRKGGLVDDEVLAAINLAMENKHAVELEGLMTITALYSEAEDARGDFRKLAELRSSLIGAGLVDRFNRSKILLSMGMSADFEIAIEEGADLVRVGTALFEE
jgi:uncharacterized pyridoxal phosphate-containing UPF0001 family protein